MRNITKAIRLPAIHFTRSSKSTGILLILCTILSILLSNLSFGEHYIQFWEKENSWLHAVGLPSNIMEWINDGLMALFFLTAGMEIKRELFTGELNSLQRAILPLFAAIGGVVAPAIIFTLLCKGTAFSHGWGIPTATDIAFSIAILSMLGRRFVPEALKIFITALAIIDDLIAILIVAFYYGGAVQWSFLLGAFITTVILYFLYKKNPTTQFIHIFLGLLSWYFMFKSGIHATMAGVIFGFLIPVDKMDKVEHALHKPVNFLIIPLFAVTNTCIPFNVSWSAVLNHQLFWGITLGLFLGKVLGIFILSYILIKAKWAVLPTRTNWYQFVGAAVLAGIGFTMSIFIATLAYDDIEWQNISKIAILMGSFLSMLVGYLWLRFQKGKLQIKKS